MAKVSTADRKAARFDGFDVRELSGYRVVPDRFGMFELRVTGIVTFSYNSQTDRHDIADQVSDYCWSVHNSAKAAVAKAHHHHNWIKKHMEEMTTALTLADGGKA